MSTRSRSVMWACARQELALSVRSAWTQTFAGVFAALAMAVAASGYVLSGGSGVQDFSRTAVSLLQLVIFLVPLTALVLGVVALTPETGTAELLFSQPIARTTVLNGQLAGLMVGLTASQAIGFGAAGLVVFLQAGSSGLAGFLSAIAASIALTAVFLSVAAALAAGDTSESRGRHLARALTIWFVAVLLYDVLALGAASLLPSGTASRTLIVSAIVNPVDAIRTAALLAAEGTTAFGSASLALLRFTGGEAWATLWLVASAAAWIVVPLVIARARLRRADI
jgi:Cu-processing system permease protein